MPEVNVVVVGGGAAGLAAAAELERWGVSVQVIEAQPRLGGRIHTIQWDRAAPIERGAQMINGDMTNVLELAASERLHLSSVPATGRDLCHVAGEVLPRSDLICADEAEALLSDAIRGWSSPREIVDSTMSLYRWWAAPWDDLGEVKRGAEFAFARTLPPKDSLGGAISRLLLCPEDEAIVRTTMAEQFGADPDEISALAAKKANTSYASDREDAEFHLPAGMARIVHTLARKLSRRPLLNTPVTRISVNNGAVQISTPTAELFAKRVIMAIPPTMARKVEFVTAHSEELYALLSAFSDGAMIKTTLIYDRSFWRTQGYSGAVTFAAPLGLEVRDTSYDTDEKPRLTAFLGGPEARARARLTEDQREHVLLGELSSALGEEAKHPCVIDEAIWVDHPWCGGGYNGYVRTGQPADAAAQLAGWSGPVTFAGAELDTDFAGYVEGAIRSGRRVAARVAREVRASVKAAHGH